MVVSSIGNEKDEIKEKINQIKLINYLYNMKDSKLNRIVKEELKKCLNETFDSEFKHRRLNEYVRNTTKEMLEEYDENQIIMNQTQLNDFVKEAVERIITKRNKDIKEDSRIYEIYQRHLIRPINESGINRMLSHGKYGFVVISANRSTIEVDWNPSIDLTEEFSKWCEMNHVNFDDMSEEQKRQAKQDAEQKFLKERNKKADSDLISDIKSKGYAYSVVYGGYHNKEATAKDSFEPSYLVYNHAKGNGDFLNWDDLFDFAVDMCNKYQQDSVYVQAPNEAPRFVNGSGQTVSANSSLNFKINRPEEEYFTTTKRKKRTTNDYKKTNGTGYAFQTEPQRFTADVQFESIYRFCAQGPSTYPERMRRGQRGEIFLHQLI